MSVALDALSPDHDYGFSGFKLSRAHELMGKTGTIKLDDMLRSESSGINEARLANMQLAVNGDYIVVSADTWVQGLELLDVNGRHIKAAGGNCLNVVGVAPGIYIVHVHINGSTATEKIRL